jgi:hypothetical protein
MSDENEEEDCRQVLAQAHVMAAEWAQKALSTDDETMLTVAHVSAAIMIAKADKCELIDFLKILITNWDMLNVTVHPFRDQEVS